MAALLAGRCRRALRRGAALAFAAPVAALLAACHATAAVHVTVHPDGSGAVSMTVTVDAEAAKRLPPPDDLIAVDDLRKAGWRIDGPHVARDGSFRVEVEKRFKTRRDGNRVLEELSSRDGPLRGMEIRRHVSLTSTRWELAGAIDLSRGVDTFGDSALTAALGNHRLSALAPALARPGDRPDAAPAVRITLDAELPGSDRLMSAGGAGLGERAKSFRLSSTQQHRSALWFTIGGGAAVTLAAGSSWWAVRGWRRDRRNRSSER